MRHGKTGIAILGQRCPFMQLKKDNKIPNHFAYQNSLLVSFHRKLTSWYGFDNVKYKSSQIWQNVPMEIKSSSSLEIFKIKTKSWTAKRCPC